MKEKIIKEKNQFIFKYQKGDILKTLSRNIGKKFDEYRKEFNKTQDYENTKYVPDFPLCLAIELVNRCNSDCIMCDKKHHEKPFAEMTLDTIKRLFDECKENKMPSIVIGAASEPFVYGKEKTLKVIKMAKEAEIMDIFLGTNGFLMDEDVSEFLVKNEIARVEISLDAATPETYRKVRGHDRLKIIEKNIDKLLKLKKKHNKELPIIRLCFVVMDINKHEVQAFVDKWKDKVDYIDFQRHINFKNPVPGNKISVNDLKIKRCTYPFYILEIFASGEVTPCASFWGEKDPVGNIHKQTIKEIWHSDKINKLRQDLLAYRFSDVCKECLFSKDDHIIDEAFSKADPEQLNK